MNKRKSGFTLIELSIVLVIIGLIIGGILVGRDLINSSGVRAQISQIEKFNAAVNTFRSKYGGLPGDLKYTEAQGFGLYYITYGPYVGLAARGDGNGLIQNRGGSVYFFDEPLIFWRHLSDSKMIEGAYGGKLNTAAETTTTIVGDYMPPSKIGTNGSIEVNSVGTGTNYFLLVSPTITGAGNCCNGTSLNPLTAIEAYQIDNKTDDGLPGSGGVFAINGAGDLSLYTTWKTVSAVSGCVSSGVYALNPGTTQDCSLRFKFQ